MDLNHRIMSYWNLRADSYDHMRQKHLHGQEFEFWKQELDNNLNGQHLQVLDIGTGTGFLAIVCASLGHKVTAIDLSDKMLQKATDSSEEFKFDITFLQMNACQMTFPSSFFDAVLCRNTIWTADNAKELYQEVFRVLKSGGCFLNYDADYGKTQFTTNSGDISYDRLMAECDAYKSLLSINHVQRPEWDLSTLRDIGFVHCECRKNVSGKFQPHGVNYSSKTPLFAIYAVKPSNLQDFPQNCDFTPFYRHNQLFYRENRRFGNNKDTEFLVLDLLCRQPEGLRSSDIIEHFYIPKQTMTRLISQMNAAGYIIQKKNPRDQRSTLIYATELGRNKHRKQTLKKQALYEQVLKNFSKEKLEQFNQLYTEFLDAFPT